MSKPVLPDTEVNRWIIKLGILGPDALLRAFQNVRYNVSDRAKKMMKGRSYFLSLREQFATVTVMPVNHLGFSNGAEYQHLCVRAVELGFDLCPEEAGPLLRRTYVRQPQGEKIRIAMTPIAVSAIEKCIFTIGHDPSGLWIGGDEVRPEDFYSADTLFAFICPLSFDTHPLLRK